MSRLVSSALAPWHTLNRRMLDSWIVADYEGIKIVDANLDERDDQDFANVTREALELIHHVDPRRFNIIKREVSYVVNSHMQSGGAYSRPNRTCDIDFGYYRFNRETDQYGWHLVRFAAVIVHEATHGRIESLGVPYDSHTRERIERLCHAEEVRFVERWSRGRFDATEFIPPFDPRRWHYYWYGSYFRHLRDAIHRIKTRGLRTPWR